MKNWLFAAVAVTITACDDPSGTSGGFITALPEEVKKVAAPFQNLNAVKVNPADGCFVYRHDGPVESTLLPLRTKKGRPICTQPKEEKPKKAA